MPSPLLRVAALGLAALVGLGPSACTDDPDEAAARRSEHSLTVAGDARTYRLYRPAHTAGRPALVVMLHGGFGSGQQAEESYGWDAAADAHGFIVAYPDGVGRAWNVGGGCCGRPGRDGIDDVGFIRAVVADIAAAFSIDPDRVYATGISNGGMLSYRLACDTELFAAVAPVAATLLGACTNPVPASVLHVHGTADTMIRYGGGKGAGVASIDGPPVVDVIATWRRVDRCAAPVDRSSGPVITSEATCPDGRAVTLVTVDGAGHQWPGSTRTRAQQLLGLDEPVPSGTLDATAIIWAFFAAHPGG